MIYVLVSICVFVLALIVHILAYKLFRKITRHNEVLLVIFSAGMIAVTAVEFLLLGNFIRFPDTGFFYAPLPFTAVATYALLSMGYLIFFIAPFLGEESPTSLLLVMLLKKKRATETEIISAFSDSELILKRLEKLKEQGFIKLRNKNYSINRRGLRIAYLVNMYRKLLGWESFG